MVAGGLGERLGYDEAKVSLAPELLTSKSFLENHCDWIFALQERARRLQPDAILPFAVMTSDDTHNAILKMMTSVQPATTNDPDGDTYTAGMTALGVFPPTAAGAGGAPSDTSTTEMLGGLSDVTILKQEKVACFSNIRGDIALNPQDPYEIVTKPHGHGDVHALLHKSGLLDRWLSRGIRWIVLFQDTNALAFRAIPSALGVSHRGDLDINMVAVQRRVGEQIGAIVGETVGDHVRNINVEYNLIDEEAFGSGSIGDSVSMFPGNINLLICKASTYGEALKKTGGLVPEFVNPKFRDAEKTEFKSPARLECMMQDLPLLLNATKHKVGYTEMERFLCFSAVKNNLQDALSKFHLTGYPESASSCESDIYSTNRRLLAMAGCDVRTTGLPIRRFAHLPFEDGAKIVLAPRFGTSVAEIRTRFPTPNLVRISDRSALVLEGDVYIQQLELDGMLVIKAAPGARVFIKNLTVRNDGCVFVESESVSNSGEGHDAKRVVVTVPASEKVRAYRKREIECMCIIAVHPNDVVIDRPGQVA